jgi:peptidoglycan/xylan/chitin deacetylase (PgdA/CDA1 family)
LVAFKQLILDGLRHAGAFGLARHFHRSRFLGATALLYHRVLPADAPADHYARLMDGPTVPQLEALVRYLKRWFRFSTPRECVERWRSGREVDPFTLLLTFDDGYADMHDLLLPVLRKYQVPATVFVTTGSIGGGYATWFQRLFSAMTRTTRAELPAFPDVPAMPLTDSRRRVRAIEAIASCQVRYAAPAWEEMIDRLAAELGWDGRIGDDERMMTWDQVEALHRSGLVTVGGHTVTHPLLAQCSPDRLERELCDSASELRGRLRLDFLPFSYPHGRMLRPEIWEAVRDSGHDCAFTGDWAPNTLATPLYRLGRQQLPADNVSRASLQLLRSDAARRAPKNMEHAKAGGGADEINAPAEALALTEQALMP